MKKPFEWIRLPLWVFLGLLIFIPWPLGGFSPWAIQVLVLTTSVVTTAYFILKLAGGQRGLPPILFLISIFSLIFQGWFMTLNAKFTSHLTTYFLLPINQIFPYLPGSLNRPVSLENIGRIIPLLAVSWMCADVSRDSTWRKRIIVAMAVAGIAVVSFGILEKISGPHRFWKEYGHNVWPFASFYYHANAGAFINLVLPLVAALAWRSAFIDTSPWWRSLWISGLVILLAGGLINASKGALIVLLMLVFLLALIAFRALRKIKDARHSIPAVLLVILLFCTTISLLAISADIRTPFQRWAEAYEMREGIASGRLQVAALCLKMSKEAGYLGFGPGTFESVFPYAAAVYGHAPSGHWRFAHEDYLQTLVEWGKIGLSIWCILYFGGVASAFYQGLTSQNGLRQRDKFLLLCLGASLIGCAVHALIDFPLQVPSIQLYVATMIGIAWGSWQWPHELSLVKKGKRRERGSRHHSKI